MQDFKTIYVVKYNNNNNFIVAPRNLSIAFDEFLSMNPNQETEIEILNSVPANNYYKPVNYTFKKHYKNGPWYEFKNTNSGPTPWYEPNMTEETWYEIQPLHFYLNKIDNPTNFTHPTTSHPSIFTPFKFNHTRRKYRPPRKPSGVTTHNRTRSTELQIEILYKGHWKRATPGQKEAYIKFLDTTEDAGSWSIDLSGKKYFFRFSPLPHVSFHEIQIENDWYRIGIKTIIH